MKEFRPQSLGKTPREKPKKTSTQKKRATKTRKTPDEIPQPPLVRYSDEELAEFKLNIEEKLKIVSKEYFDMETRLISLLREDPGDSADAAALAATKSEVERERKRAHDHMKGLENALIRVENKSYGVCRDTGKLIPKDRLLQTPHATLSVEAKNKRDAIC